MQHVRLRHVVLILADILESAGRAVIAVADNHAVLHHQRANLTTLAVAVLCPDAGHLQIAQVKLQLLFLIHITSYFFHLTSSLFLFRCA